MRLPILPKPTDDDHKRCNKCRHAILRIDKPGGSRICPLCGHLITRRGSKRLNKHVGGLGQ